MKYVATVIITLALLVLGALAFAYSGVYDVGADDAHTAPVLAALENVRDRSIAARADDLQVPSDLGDPARIRQGSGNYAAMCAGCHLAPGIEGTELSRGLYPSPPNLSKVQVDAAQAFWVIKHGIKASGMPAWGKSMDDEYIWNMAAFLQVLPKLDAAGYQAMVASSGGHSHGGGETGGHAHGAADSEAGHHDEAGATGAEHNHDAAEGEAHDHADEAADHPHPTGTPEHHQDAATDPSAEPRMVTHRHADGTVESHPAEPTSESTTSDADADADADAGTGETAHDDGHDHQH